MEALSPATLRAKAQAGYGSKGILQRTGALRRGFKITQKGFGFVKISNPVPYFKYHEQGGPVIPKRQMLAVPNKSAKQVMKIFQKHVRNILK